MDDDSMRDYLDRCRELSLTARRAIVLLVFERYCATNGLEGEITTDFSDYLWQWPLIDGPDQFDPWQESRPELVDYGLGDPSSDSLTKLLASADVDDSHFRMMVEAVVEILWGNVWGRAEDERSLQRLSDVLRITGVSAPPPLTPFLFSRFAEEHGWGRKLTREDRDYWRHCTRFP